MGAIASLLISNLPMLLKVGQDGWQFVTNMRATLKQNNAWTVAQEEQFLATLQQEGVAPESLPDPQ